MTWGSQHRIGFSAAQNAWENPPDDGNDEEYEPEPFTAIVVMLEPDTDRELARIEVKGVAWRDSYDSIEFEVDDDCKPALYEWGWNGMDEQDIQGQILEYIDIPTWAEYLSNLYDWR